ncbi:dnaJ homolog subfamily C member 12 isoform X2 [Perognathus longimembris pacificus]|nr:dnaJ homolog subfamily C member 12 isoform X2 [Perognathus longimembris pacificus]
MAEFKARALECHPDKHPENSKAVETFQKLQKAKEILTNEESRARYDHWRRSQVAMPFQQWEALADSVKMSMHWAVRGKKDLMLLGGSDQTQTNKSENEDWNEEREIKREYLGSSAEKMKQQESKSISPPNLDSPNSDVSCWHFRFRWTGDAPSDLLRKFRNYEI